MKEELSDLFQCLDIFDSGMDLAIEKHSKNSWRLDGAGSYYNDHGYAIGGLDVRLTFYPLRKVIKCGLFDVCRFPAATKKHFYEYRYDDHYLETLWSVINGKPGGEQDFWSMFWDEVDPDGEYLTKFELEVI